MTRQHLHIVSNTQKPLVKPCKYSSTRHMEQQIIEDIGDLIMRSRLVSALRLGGILLSDFKGTIRIFLSLISSHSTATMHVNPKYQGPTVRRGFFDCPTTVANVMSPSSIPSRPYAVAGHGRALKLAPWCSVRKWHVTGVVSGSGSVNAGSEWNAKEINQSRTEQDWMRQTDRRMLKQSGSLSCSGVLVEDNKSKDA
jgi:hypothetical protein